MMIAMQPGRNGVKKIAAYVRESVKVALTFRPQVSQAEAKKRLQAALDKLTGDK